jgi:hypothetical protein
MTKIPPIDFLLVCSGMSLQDCELAHLNRAANVRKTLIRLLDELVEAEGEALLARRLIDYRDAMPGYPRAPLQMVFRFETHPALPAAPRKSARAARTKAVCA